MYDRLIAEPEPAPIIYNTGFIIKDEGVAVIESCRVRYPAVFTAIHPAQRYKRACL